MSGHASLLRPTLIVIILCAVGSANVTCDQPGIKEVVNQAYAKTHDGWSCDEVLLDDTLNKQFIDECRKQLKDASAEDLNWALLNLRKAGQLEAKATKRKAVDTRDIAHIAEIATRNLLDRHRVSTDRIMVKPELRAEFDKLALALAPNIDPYLVRRAAFRLRKTRQLKPELITRIVTWGRQVNSYSADEVQKKPDRISTNPGIYIFRDSTGYLYIGQTDNLRNRLKAHLDESHSHSLKTYLKDQGINQITIETHSFDPKSQAGEVMARRAYESELIASRKPRFNVQP